MKEFEIQMKGVKEMNRYEVKIVDSGLY